MPYDVGRLRTSIGREERVPIPIRMRTSSPLTLEASGILAKQIKLMEFLSTPLAFNKLVCYAICGEFRHKRFLSEEIIHALSTYASTFNVESKMVNESGSKIWGTVVGHYERVGMVHQVTARYTFNACVRPYKLWWIDDHDEAKACTASVVNSLCLSWAKDYSEYLLEDVEVVDIEDIPSNR